MKKRILCGMLSVSLLMGNIVFTDTACAWSFQVETKEGAASANRHGQEYNGNAYHTVKSHLFQNEDGTFARVELIDNEIVAETYSSEFVLQDTKKISLELSVYGGIYASKDAYFVVEGERNYEERTGVPEFRIIKYDKNWNRLASDDVTEANTVDPFDFGSCRFSEYGGKLYIRTCHKMYKNKEDGLNHQASVMMRLDMETCRVEAVTKDVANSSVGYVSHSFNQFTVNKNGTLYACDHGDAYPRSMVILKYQNLESGQWNSRADSVEAMPFVGRIGDNYTGAVLGGFAVTDSRAVLAGASMPQDGTVSESDVQNIFISTVSTEDFSSGSLKTVWVTDYPQNGTETVSNPQLITISDDKLLLIWEVCDVDKVYKGELHYVFLNGDGEIDSRVYSVDAALSDCEPIVSGNSLVWYVTGFDKYSKKSPVFYTLPLDKIMVTGITLNEDKVSLKVGDSFHLSASIEPFDASDKNVTWKSSDSSVAAVTDTGEVTAVGAGTAEITAVAEDGGYEAVCKVEVTGPLQIGDVDGNQEISSSDALMVLKFAADLLEPSDEQEKAADVNQDGEVNSSDALSILKYAAKLITEF